MKIVYDENKRILNLRKHGLDFAALRPEFFAAGIVVLAKLNRLKAIGPFDGETVSVVFFQLGSEGLSVISMRPASRTERKLYGKR
ncbi:BrnT family toxin [Pararhizobium sp. O133]|uniref:BrnT family toxin n=1 Tax=Pararhizobium sp. O133 TaxID=3449278 RepID=UPI003F6852F8